MKTDTKNGVRKPITVILFAVIMIASVLAVTTPIGCSALVPEPLEGVHLQTSGDNPLTTSYTWTGNGNVVVDVVPFVHATNPSGTFTISGIPAGSAIVNAYMYGQEWEYSSGEMASATLSGTSLGTIAPITNDPGGGLNLATYRWDATSIVTGNGGYTFTTSGLKQSYGAALVVVYSNPSESHRQIIINDGAESLLSSTSTTTFSGVLPGTGKLIIFTEADDETGTSEKISFNSAVILGPGNIFNANQGNYSSLFALPINSVAGTNTASITTDEDWFGWELAILATITNQPPIADAGPDQTVEQTYYQGADVTLNGSGSNDPDGDLLTYSWTWAGGSATGVNPIVSLPLGTTTITLVVNDGTVDSAPDTVAITVQDTTPPDISVTVSPDTLWPPNHKMVDIVAVVTVSDICDADPTVVLTSITSDEPDNAIGIGDGNTINDIQLGTDDYEFQLRAERAGTGDGRVYTITYTVTDVSGNSASESATVVVPHDMD